MPQSKPFLDSSYFDENFKNFVDSLNGKQKYLRCRKIKSLKKIHSKTWANSCSYHKTYSEVPH